MSIELSGIIVTTVISSVGFATALLDLIKNGSINSFLLRLHKKLKLRYVSKILAKRILKRCEDPLDGYKFLEVYRDRSTRTYLCKVSRDRLYILDGLMNLDEIDIIFKCYEYLSSK